MVEQQHREHAVRRDDVELEGGLVRDGRDARVGDVPDDLAAGVGAVVDGGEHYIYRVISAGVSAYR